MQIILAERQRQIAEEGWTPEHDDGHADHELQRAAECYFLSAGMYLSGFKSFRAPDQWPWEDHYWKPSKPLRDFTKAGALWLAEIDRLKRLGSKCQSPTIMENLRTRVKECAHHIDELLKRGET